MLTQSTESEEFSEVNEGRSSGGTFPPARRWIFQLAFAKRRGIFAVPQVASGAAIRGGASADRKTSLRKACIGPKRWEQMLCSGRNRLQSKRKPFLSLKCRRAGKMNLHTLFKFSRIVRREVASWSGGGDNDPSGFISGDQPE